MAEEQAPRVGARAPRGFADRRGPSLQAERRILEAVVGVYERFGFEPLDTGAIEYADALGKFLPDDDRPNEGVFSFRDDDEQWLALRYDLTAPLARYAAENQAGLPRPFRRYAFGPVWRNEKPGPGHGRQFVQCDADTVGSSRPEADAELVAMAVEACAAAGLARGAVSLRINSRKILNGLLSACGIAQEPRRLAVLRAVDKLDRLGPRAVADLLGPGRKDASGAFTAGAGLDTAAIGAVLAFLEAGRGSRSQTLDALADTIGGSAEGAQGLDELARIHQALSGLGIDEEEAVFDPSVVRGLEYYTGAVFEAQFTGSGLADPAQARRFGSIGGGGRYDDLVARFTGETVPATGFSFGISRLAEALDAGGVLLGTAARGPVVVIVLDPGRMADYLALARELRAAGVASEVYLGDAGMRGQLKYADKRLSPAAVIMGEDEIANGEVTIKDLDLGRRLAAAVADNRAWREERPGQQSVPRGQWVEAVLRILEGTR